MTLDGIPVGTLRSNMADAKVSAEQWCRTFGHKYKTDIDGNVYCSGCFKSLDELNLEYHGESERAKAGQ